MTIKELCNVFRNKVWYNPDNRDLLNLVEQGRLNIEPACIKSLDKVGLNHLEIINLVPCIGKQLGSLPAADVDHLNYLQDKYGIVFNAEEKQSYTDKKVKRHPAMTKLNGYYYHNVNGYWLGSAALLQLQSER